MSNKAMIDWCTATKPQRRAIKTQFTEIGQRARAAGVSLNPTTYSGVHTAVHELGDALDLLAAQPPAPNPVVRGAFDAATTQLHQAIDFLDGDVDSDEAFAAMQEAFATAFDRGCNLMNRADNKMLASCGNPPARR